MELQPFHAGSSPVPHTTSTRTRAQAALVVMDDLHLVRVLGQKVTHGDGLATEIRGVLAEACLQRVVRLVRFFYEVPGTRPTIRAEDYVADADTWFEARPPIPGLISSHLKQMIDMVDQDRWEKSEPLRSYRCWPFLSLAGELERLMTTFEAHLNSETSGWFTTARKSVVIN